MLAVIRAHPRHAAAGIAALAQTHVLHPRRSIVSSLIVSRAITKSSTRPLRALTLPSASCPIANFPIARAPRASAPNASAPAAVAPIAMAPSRRTAGNLAPVGLDRAEPTTSFCPSSVILCPPCRQSSVDRSQRSPLRARHNGSRALLEGLGRNTTPDANLDNSACDEKFTRQAISSTAFGIAAPGGLVFDGIAVGHSCLHEVDMILTEWGMAGVETLRAQAAVLIIVDVLSFSTAVDVAVSKGAMVYPFPYGDEDTAQAVAERVGAVLAKPRRSSGGQFSLSPLSLIAVPAGTRVMLPSPNGARLSLAGGDRPVLAGCLRNATMVARIARQIARGDKVGVVLAGELWPDGSLRPAIEDLLGAGAIVHHLALPCSPEAQAAREAFRSAGTDVERLAIARRS